MLIYNYQKEFVGIDESDLKALGFSDLSQLRAESADFADLFVKTPGFVHNFKHVHWIDFVTCAEGSEASKVIIHANSKNFRCTLDIKTAYLVDDPSQKAYIINLLNLRALTHGENEQVAGDILEKPAPRVYSQNTAIFNTPDFSSDFNDDKVITSEPIEKMEVTHDPYEISPTDTIDELEINPKIVEDIYEDSPIDLGDDLLELDEMEEEIQEAQNVEPQQIKEPLKTLYTQVLHAGNDYIYDPHLASDELGLPVDLIEEFIQDFISQANDFKDDLYNALNDGNKDNVKILSHKLKGVAANLRIEDAFEVLSTINTSDNTEEIKANIDTLYTIIEKLSTKNNRPVVSAPMSQSAEEEVSNEDDDDLIISFKDEEFSKIQDCEVPQKIEMPELADDDFLTFDDSKDEELEGITLNNELDSLDEITLDDELDSFEEIQTEQITPEILPIHYNKTQAAKEIGIEAENFEALFNDYIIEGNKACSDIYEAIKENNHNTWRQTAIKLKGMSDNMRIHDFTTELESIIHTQDSTEVKEAVDSISTKLQQISSKEV